MSLSLEEILRAELFPELDMALRRGRHVDAEDGEWYGFLLDAQDELGALYTRYGAELVHKPDGYFHLLVTGELLGRRHLSATDMMVGQALALLHLDPRTLEHGGSVSHADVLAHLAALLGTETLVRALNPKRKRIDPRIAEETARQRVLEAVRRLAGLGFVRLLEGDRLRLRPALLRFADPVRTAESPDEELRRLVAKGELVETQAGGDEASEDDGADERPSSDDEGIDDAHPARDDEPSGLGAAVDDGEEPGA